MAEPWTPQLVAERLEEAADTLARLPEQRAHGYPSPWPTIVGVGGGARPIAPAPEAIDRLDQALGWLAWLEADEARLVWLRAEGVPCKRITLRPGVGRTTAWQRWVAALLKVATRLNAAAERTRPNNKTMNSRTRDVLCAG